MATLTSAAFLSTYNSIFADNSARDISEADMRAFTTDIKDSFLNKTDGGTITGNIGIGAAPSVILHISAASPEVRIEAEAGNFPFLEFVSGGSRTVGEYMDMYKHTDHSLRINNGPDRFIFSAAGEGTAVDWIATSDRRLKNNIRRINDDVLDKIKKIGAIVSTYERIGTGKKETGFIAQELLEIAPEYVNVPDDPTEMMGVNYAKMCALLFKGFEQILR